MYPDDVALSGQHTDYILAYWSRPSSGGMCLDEEYRFYVFLKDVVFQGVRDFLSIISPVNGRSGVRTVIERKHNFDHLFFCGMCGRGRGAAARRRRA